MELSSLAGIGKTRLQRLKEADILTPLDLLQRLPQSYINTLEPRQIIHLKPGQACVEARVLGKPKLRYLKGLSMVSAIVADSSAEIQVLWFNQPWVYQQLKEGETLLLYGKVEVYQTRLSLLNPKRETEKGIFPQYAPIKGIPNAVFSSLIRQILNNPHALSEELFPEDFRLKHGICPILQSYRDAHFPPDLKALALARRSLAYENLLLFQAAVYDSGKRSANGIRLTNPVAELDNFLSSLPFDATSAQKSALVEIQEDLHSGMEMRRMVQGDVGSGKTVVAFGAAYMMFREGYQSALMAPTEILARQHLKTAQGLLEALGLHCGLLVGSVKAGERREALKSIASGEWDLVIGTNALLSEGVQYQRLGLVMTDEQHRFGVKQREKLKEKSEFSPHVLVFSATPIPRSLALVLYGDLDITVLNELPPGRSPVKTHLLPESKREGLYRFVREHAQSGEQCYWICPLVEESEGLEAEDAQNLYDKLSRGPLKGISTGLLHGRLDAEESAQTLRAFVSGEIKVLVATTVVEVGMDVPNAKILVVENAERFGLSQLHQLRGRVGRGRGESWCFLFGENSPRLETIVQTNDGFQIAQKDLELRGPGEFLGTRQHGSFLPNTYGLDQLELLEECAAVFKGLLKDPLQTELTKRLFDEAGKRYRGKMSGAGVH